MDAARFLLIIVPFIISFLGALLIYKKLLGLGKVGATLWSVLAFGVGYMITFFIAFVIFCNAIGVHC